MTTLSDALNTLLEELGDEPYSIKGNNRGIVVSLTDRTVMIDDEGHLIQDRRDAVPVTAAVRAPAIQPTWVDPASAARAQQELEDEAYAKRNERKGSVDAEGYSTEKPLQPSLKTMDAHVAKFTKEESERLFPLIDLKYTMTLDCERKIDFEEEDVDFNIAGLGFLEEDQFKGNVIVYRKRDANEDWPTRRKLDAKWLKKRFRTFKQDDDEIAVEITYTPWISGHWDSDSYLKRLYDATQLATVISFEDFLTDVRHEASWVENLFSGAEIYELFFHVVAPGKPATEEWGDSLLEDEPLWIQRKGKKYNVHILEHVD